MASMVLQLASILALPGLSEARLGSGIVDLTAASFDDFVRTNPRVMVDFMNSSSEENQENNKELDLGIRKLRQLGNSAPVARVDVAREPELVRRFMEVGCSEDPESQLCGSQLPQLLWFARGEPTQYHRYLRTSHNIATFVLVLDREAVTTIVNEPREFEFSQVVLAKLPKQSPEFQALEAAAAKYMDTVAFLHIEAEGSNITWVDNSTLKDYYTEAVEKEAVAKWVRVHVTQSEDLPESPVDGGSVVVVGKNFEETVLREDRDVVLMAYAPWCGFSRKVMPTWAKFAQRASGSHLVVAKMDGTRNRSPIPDFHWTVFPTIIFVAKGTRQPVAFEGTNRTVEAFMEFASKHASSPLGFLSDEAVLLQGGTVLQDDDDL